MDRVDSFSKRIGTSQGDENGKGNETHFCMTMTNDYLSEVCVAVWLLAIYMRMEVHCDGKEYYEKKNRIGIKLQ